MTLSIKQIQSKLKKLGLISEDGKPLSYAAFKNRATISRFSGRRKYKAVFVGQPKDNLFGFYTMYGTDPEVMKEAYDYFIQLVKGNSEPYDEGDVQWGNCGIPIAYGNLRAI